MPFGKYGNIGKERRDAKKQARKFGGIGQAGRAQKEQAADRICGNEYQLVSRIGQSARSREWQALLQKIHRPDEEEKCEKISICNGDVGMGHGVNANFAPGAVKFEVPNTNRLSSPFCDIFGAPALRTFEPFILPPFHSSVPERCLQSLRIGFVARCNFQHLYLLGGQPSLYDA
jgi:hypothetical protein